MTGEIIKSFLVGLGFSVDESDLAKFNKAINQATLKVTALYTSVQVMAAGIFYSITKISESFEDMGYEYKLIAPAINKALILRQELFKAYAAAGVNITKVVQASVKLNMSITKTKYALDAIYKSVGSRFFALLTKQSDLFRQKIYQNMPKIQNALERFIKFVFKALEATTALGLRLWSILTRVWDFFTKLDKATDGWSTIVLGLIAAWKLLNLEFLATPLGMILTGFLAILALYDDFKTFQEGGKSLFDWTPFIPVINAVAEALKILKGVLQSLFDITFNLVDAFYKLFTGNFSGFFDGITEAAKSTVEALGRLWDSLKAIVGVGSALGTFASGLFGGNNAQTNIQNNPAVSPLVNPIGTGGNVANTNQNVNQQTSINIMGGVDALATGKAVVGQQGRVNSDMIRNMKGATR